MHEALKVYLKGCLVGWLSHETSGDLYSFRYDARYLEAPREGPLSFSLPLMPEAFDAERTYGFFANLLPPLVVRTKLGASLHLSRNNVFTERRPRTSSSRRPRTSRIPSRTSSSAKGWLAPSG